MPRMPGFGASAIRSPAATEGGSHAAPPEVSDPGQLCLEPRPLSFQPHQIQIPGRVDSSPSCRRWLRLQGALNFAPETRPIDPHLAYSVHCQPLTTGGRPPILPNRPSHRGYHEAFRASALAAYAVPGARPNAAQVRTMTAGNQLAGERT